MRRVNYGAESLVTGTRAADALMEYASFVVRMRTSVAVQIRVLEDDGTIRTHFLLLGPATQLDMFDIDCPETGSETGPETGSDARVGQPAEREIETFPVPRFPAIGGSASAMPTEELWFEAHSYDSD